MTRLAFLSPIPPARTGVADYAADVLRVLADQYEIDVFHAQAAVDPLALPAGVRCHHASGFLKRHAARPFDLAIYQMGNGPAHAFLYEAMAAVPGLLVLHDLVLHHSRARMFLASAPVAAYARAPGDPELRDAARSALDEYRRELAYSYPAQAGRLAAVQLGSIGELLPYAFPLFRLPAEASRLVATHNDFMAEAVRAELPGAEVLRIPMPVPSAVVGAEAVAALRLRLGIGPEEVVVGSFGLLTREKQIETVARAVARAAAALPRVRLLLVGPDPDPPRLLRLLDRLGLRGRTVVAGHVPLWTLPAHIEAADLVAHLRYPTARETSAALLRVLAQGRPTIISDLEHLADIPANAVVRADLTDEEGELTRGILRLAASPALRERLGAAARAFVLKEHSPALCRAGYAAAIDLAMARPVPRAREGWPPAWRASAPA